MDDRELIERARANAGISAQTETDRLLIALADRLSEREGWVMVPRKALPAMLEQAAFNLCAEYGVDFVKPLGKFVEDAYEELVSAASALPSPPGKLGR